MNTLIRTANLFTYQGEDKIDITVKYAGDHPEYVGACLAPTWALVGGVKHWHYAAELERITRANLRDSDEGFKVYKRLLKWKQYPMLSELQYTAAYLNLLRERFKTNPNPFIEIASMDQVTLCCYCIGVHAGKFCHRTIAIEAVAGVAKSLGHTPIVIGELA